MDGETIKWLTIDRALAILYRKLSVKRINSLGFINSPYLVATSTCVVYDHRSYFWPMELWNSDLPLQ